MTLINMEQLIRFDCGKSLARLDRYANRFEMFGEAIEKSIHLRLLFSYGCLVGRWHLRADSCGASGVSNWLQIDFHALAEMSTLTKRRSFALLFDNVRNLCMNLQLGRRFKITKILSIHFLSRFHLISILF